MSDRSWFYASQGQQQGPYPEAQFRDLIARGVVAADTLVWSEGMAGWEKAGDIPGLFSGASGPPVLPRSGGSPAGAGGLAGGPVSIDVGTWELLWRSVLLWVGSLFVIPMPWLTVWYCRWLVSRLQVPQHRRLDFTGKPMDLWWLLAAVVLAIAVAVVGIGFLNFGRGVLNIAMLLIQVALYWFLLRWFVANISADGQPLSIAFRGSFWTYLGWHVLAIISVITIIGWAWVTAAWIRWICRSIDGTRREVVFNGSGWEILWRTVVSSLLAGLIIPIPWVLAWYTRWFLSQFALAEREA
jgi:hypothetical protein